MKVTLVGAGPGDGGLITVKAVETLKGADVVLYDRLVGGDILKLIPSHAEKINVGKHADHHPVPQHEINRLLVEKARQGGHVVRLKGGDPLIFGRGGEELEYLREHNIPFEVVPGISSVVAAGAYAGIPVTHRDYVSSLHIITGHPKGGEPDIDFDSLVKLNGTLMFLMSVAVIPFICEGCIAAGMTRDMPAAIIENATSSKQRKWVGTLESLPDIAKKHNVKPPAMIIVGKVCLLSESLDWFSARPLTGKKIVVTRARESASVLSKRLKDLGAEVMEIPCIRTYPLTQDNAGLNQAIQNIRDFSWLVFSSGTGVHVFFDHLQQSKVDIRVLHHLRIAVVGPETEKELEKRGLRADYVPEIYNGEELAKGIIRLHPEKKNEKSGKVLIAGASGGAEDMKRIFAENHIAFENMTIYETQHVEDENKDTEWPICGHDVDLVTFTSSSTVEGFVKRNPDMDFGRIKAVCIGEKTESTATRYGMKTVVSEQATIKSLIEKIQEEVKK